MTDPIIEALDQLVPPYESVVADWQAILDVASPARRKWLPPHPQRRRRTLVVALALLATTAVATAAVATTLGAFNGISAAQQAQIGTPGIDPATAAYVQDHLAGIQLDTARHVRQLPDGENVYLITGSQNDLCTVVGPTNPEAWCGAPLSNSHPATIYGYLTGNDPGTRWINFGLAIDGVTSVSFQPTQAASGGPGGAEVTVPVHDNLWIYPSNDTWPPYALQPVTAHFADGTTVVEPATGQNCAAC